MREGRSSGTATVLFTDLVGSTEMLSRLGEATFDELRRAHFATLRSALTGHGGEEVKTLGDGVLAVFRSASDAVACAVAIQQAVHRPSGSPPASLSVRVGLALGDVSFEEDDVFGTPVVEAARLVAAAAPGQILATAIVQAVAGGRSEASFGDVRLLDLKGLPQPVPTCEVHWERLKLASVPMPALLTDVGRIFVGREAELERLGQLWKEAAAGERRLALLAGEPGVGKTRLAAELALRVRDEGAIVLAGRCDEDLGVPYQPFVEALRHFVDHIAAGDLPERLGRYGAELTRLVPELAELAPALPAPLRSDPDTERYRLFDAVGAWLAAASGEEPVLLVADDLQWAAKPTLLLLRHVLRPAGATRLLIVGTYRDTELGHDHPLVDVLADLRRQGGVERLSLMGLDSSGVAAYMEEAAGHDLDENDVALARAIYEETEGNPLFVREVFRHLTETGEIERREGRWTTRRPVAELGIPESVRDVVGRRLSRLSPETNQVLRTAAVVGPEFAVAVLEAAASHDEDAVLSALEEATAARLINEVSDSGQRYRFTHALVRDTLYGELSAARRVALHRRVGEAIERVHADRLDDHLPALAHHWARASVPAADTLRAVDYATRAGDRALAQLAHDEAASYYRQGLELLQVAERPAGRTQYLELLISLGEAQRRAGDPNHRETLLDAVRHATAQGDSGALVRAALANTRGALYSAAGKIDAERVAALETALAVVPHDDRSLRARVLANLGLELTWSDRDRRLRLSDEALTLARTAGDTAALAEVLVARYYAIAAPDTLTERLANTAELLGLVEQLGDPVALSRALALRFRVAMESGDVAEADRCLEQNEPLATELGQPALRWLVSVQHAGRDLLAGRFEVAEAQVRSALEIGRSTGQPDAPFIFLGQLAAIRFEQGRLDEMVDQLVLLPDQYRTFPTAYSLLALAYAETGRAEEARNVFETLLTSDFAKSAFDAVWLRWVSDCATVCAALRDTDRAAMLHRRLAPYADQFPVFGIGTASGSVSYYLGLLATTTRAFDEAEARFATAAATHERIGAPSWLARTRLEWAGMLLIRQMPGDAEQGRELLGQAVETARTLGLANVERRAVELLQ